MPGYLRFLSSCMRHRTHGRGRATSGDGGADRRGSFFLPGDRPFGGAFGCASEDSAPDKRVYSVALWSLFVSFTANYAAVPLTEVFAVLWTGSPAISLCLHFGESPRPDFMPKSSQLPLQRSVNTLPLRGVRCWHGKLFRLKRPSPGRCVHRVGDAFLTLGSMRRWFSNSLAMVLGCLVVLSRGPCATGCAGRTHSSLRKNFKSAGELVPYGFMAWKKPGSSASAIVTWCRGS